jgi:hypothetical protein
VGRTDEALTAPGEMAADDRAAWRKQQANSYLYSQ